MKAPQPATRPWFSATPSYSGNGQADFGQPALTVTGATIVTCGEDGVIEIGMSPDSLPSDFAIVFGGEPTTDNGTYREWLISDATFGNPCNRLEVITAEGTFEAIGATLVGYDAQKQPPLIFHCMEGLFRSASMKEAKYWVLPLQNFHTRFMRRYPSLNEHILRLNPPSPEVIAREDQYEQNPAWSWLPLRSAHPLIGFLFQEAPAFIEPLPDYQERLNLLNAKKVSRCLTSAMVGEIGGQEIDPAALEGWVPFYFLSLLGVACGTEVGAPWIEFRGELGELVARYHNQQNRPCFSNARGAIDESLHGDGLKRLLTRAQSSPERNSDPLHVAIKLLLRGGWDAPSVEDRIVQLCRALETLCAAYKLTSPSRPEETLAALQAEDRQELAEILADARQRVRALEQRVRREGHTNEAGVLDRILDQMSRVDQTSRGFPDAVLRLLERFDLHDAKAMHDFEQANGITGVRRWLRKLGKYRNEPTHVGYFQFRDKTFDVMDVVRFSTHLHDLITRVVLCMVGYDGYYQPFTQTWTAVEKVLWVQPDTKPRRLGYDERELSRVGT